MAHDHRWFVGIDWGTAAHDVTVINDDRSVIEHRRVPHEADAVQACFDWILARTGVPSPAITIAIERPRGVLVSGALERGFRVVAINPKQLDRFRDRFTVAGAKDDRFDALVLADSVRTDPQAFSDVPLDGPVILQLRELSHADEDLKRDLRRLTNRLREQLFRVAPALLPLCPAADEPWFWSLIESAPTPPTQRQLSRATIQRLLTRHRIRRVTAADVSAALHAPAFVLAPGVIEAVHEAVALLLPQLRVLEAQQRRCREREKTLLAALETEPAADADQRNHRDVEILASLPGVGRMVTVTMLAEAGSLLAHRDYRRLRAQSGAAPVTKASGKRREVRMRRACNPRLRQALYHWARVSLQRDAAALAYYRDLRLRGQSHGHALRAVGDRWLRILVAMLTTHTLYDASRLKCRAVAA